MGRSGKVLSMLLLQGCSTSALQLDADPTGDSSGLTAHERHIVRHMMLMGRMLRSNRSNQSTHRYIKTDVNAPKGENAPLEVVEGPDDPLSHHANNVDYVYPGERPGCFMRMPSGCPNHFMKTTHWRHEIWAEAHEADKSTCEMRKHFWDDFCGTNDVKVFYFGEPVTEEEKDFMVLDKYPGVASTASGCFVRLPDGCPNHVTKSRFWRHDLSLEEMSVDRDDCMDRKVDWIEYCATTNVKIVYVPPDSRRADGSDPLPSVRSLDYGDLPKVPTPS